MLLFAERPERVYPQFVAKGARFPGLGVHIDRYEDSADFEGPLSRLFKDALAFVMRNLHKVQPASGVNEPGMPEIPERVFEELLVNALVHRDYLVSAPIRIFIFDDRVEIVSSGTLTNNLTIANIRTGNSNIRNPILISYAAKGLLPYRGLGSGILRALEAWPAIDFEDDRDGSLFRAIVRRTRPVTEKRGDFTPEITPETCDLHRKQEFSDANSHGFAPEIAPKLLALLERISANPRITTAELASVLNVSRRTVLNRITTLKKKGLLRRAGSTKNGQWVLIP